jgi:hypothetical protein
MATAYDWRQFVKSETKLWLTTDIIDRCRILSANCLSLNAECSNEFYGTFDNKANVAVMDRMSDMCLTSDPGAGNYLASSHSNSVLDNPACYNAFERFWESATENSCILSVHTHMFGQYLEDGSLYEDFWKFSAADLNGYIGHTEILARKKVKFFGGILYICKDSRIGLAIVRLNEERNKFYHVNDINLIDYSNGLRSSLNADSYGSQYIGYAR